MHEEDVYLENERLVTFTMKRDFPQFLGDEDAMQEGRIGLWRAVKAFDESRGCSISTLAIPAIHNHIEMYIRSLKKASCPTAYSLYELTSASEDADEVIDQLPFYYDDVDWRLDIEDFLKSIDKDSRSLVLKRAEGYTDIEISDEFGVTREAIRQRRQKLRKMYQRFQKEGVVT